MESNTTQQLTYGGYRYDEAIDDLIDSDGKSIRLRNQSVKVFRHLQQHSDHVVSKDDLIKAVWPDVAVTDDSLVQCVSEVRKAIKDTNRKILKTIPRRGYLLQSDKNNGTVVTEHQDEIALPSLERTTKRRWDAVFPVFFLCLLIFVVVLAKLDVPPNLLDEQSRLIEANIPTLSLEISPDTSSDQSGVVQALMAELRAIFSRYRTVRLTDATSAEFNLSIAGLPLHSPDQRVSIELTNEDSLLLFAETYEFPESSASSKQLANRLAAAIASPGIGAIDRRLLARSKLLPPDQISKAECYANGFGCSKCSGEEDNIREHAEACLAYIIEEDPADARAWALQATIYAHQYLWGNTLPEPMRSTPKLREHLPKMAIEAASRAEKLSDGRDTSVYWGMAEAYFSSCQGDKLYTAIQRGLAINPDDPNLLAAFGNWLSYSGRWDEGAALTRRALTIESRHFQKWWWMGIAKTHYFKKEYKQAYDNFLNAFNERNWLSHLQLAYTLPHLGRIDDARQSVKDALSLYPGLTVEKALEIYKTICFPDRFLSDMKSALVAAGMPSRGDSSDFTNLIQPRAQVININGLDVEYHDVGDGEPVVFVHGALADYRSWAYYLVPVSEEHRYISYSRRYFGTQPWQDNGENFSVEVFANDLIAFIEVLNFGPVHLVSWSSGVRTAMTAAVKRPDLIKSAIHFEPVENNIFGNDTSIASLRDDWFSRFQSVDQHMVRGDLEGAAKRMLETVFELSPGGYEQEKELQKEVIRQNARTLPINFKNFGIDEIKLTCEHMQLVETPTLIVKGGETHDYWQRMAERFSECIPGAKLATIAGVNHKGPIDAVEQLTHLILGFVDIHSPR